MKHRRASLMAFMMLVALMLPLLADQRPSFVFGGKQFYVGMSMSEAVRPISVCCQLSPPIKANSEKNPRTATGGHFIMKKDGAGTSMLGAIFFADQKVTRLTKPIADGVDFSNDDLVTFTRALKRVLQNDAGSASCMKNGFWVPQLSHFRTVVGIVESVCDYRSLFILAHSGHQQVSGCVQRDCVRLVVEHAR